MRRPFTLSLIHICRYQAAPNARPRGTIVTLINGLAYSNNQEIEVTIVPRGRALGAAWYLPEERQITTKEQMLDEMCATLGGRAAEDLFLGRISTGAMNDLDVYKRQR